MFDVAIVDEVDRTAAARLVEDLVDIRDFEVDADRTTVVLTDAGLDALEAQLGVNLYDEQHVGTLTILNLALHARGLLQRDVDDLVQDGRLRLINESRGRVARLQRWPDGLHAAVEAKEGLADSEPGQVLDSITIQDLATQHKTLCGMSGTVLDVAEDLREFYEMRAGRVQRHEPNRRVDETPVVTVTAEEKWDAVVDELCAVHETGAPVLVGTQSVAESDLLAARLRERGLDPRVLNARNDAEEAAIIACAGQFGAVTISTSTQMSGRGTDIRLDEPARGAGGLAVIAAGRYPSGRLDAQLRGRSGRQGDPGRSVVFVSMEDDLVARRASATWTYMVTDDPFGMPGGRFIRSLSRLVRR
ncbi:MAG: hypothetical protein QM607_12305 [Microbacterium sp.]